MCFRHANALKLPKSKRVLGHRQAAYLIFRPYGLACAASSTQVSRSPPSAAFAFKDSEHFQPVIDLLGVEDQSSEFSILEIIWFMGRSQVSVYSKTLAVSLSAESNH